MFGAWLYHNFSSLSSPPVTMTGGGCFHPLNSNPKGNPTKALLKNSRFRHSKIAKTLDFIGVFRCSFARCEMAFSQFSRNFLAFSRNFWSVSNPFSKGFRDYSGQFNNLRRHIEAVITRLSWKQFGSESPRGFESLCLRQSLGALCSKAFFFWNISMLSP